MDQDQTAQMRAHIPCPHDNASLVENIANNMGRDQTASAYLLCLLHMYNCTPDCFKMEANAMNPGQTASKNEFISPEKTYHTT